MSIKVEGGERPVAGGLIDNGVGGAHAACISAAHYFACSACVALGHMSS
jgi:hypothetical protein